MKFIRFALAAMVAISALTSNRAVAEENTAPAAPANPQPAPQPPPTCNQKFVLEYNTLTKLVQASGSYFDAGEISPALAETAFACHRLRTDFPNTVCSLPKAAQTPKTSDFDSPCSFIMTVFLATGGSLNANSVTDATAFGLLKAESLQVTISNPIAFQSLIAEPMMKYAVNGQILTMEQTLESDASVRCTIQREAGLFFLPFITGAMKGVFLYESFLSGVRASHLIVNNGAIDITCSKESNAPMTLGDIKAAFGTILSIGVL